MCENVEGKGERKKEMLVTVVDAFKLLLRNECFYIVGHSSGRAYPLSIYPLELHAELEWLLAPQSYRPFSSIANPDVFFQFFKSRRHGFPSYNFRV